MSDNPPELTPPSTTSQRLARALRALRPQPRPAPAPAPAPVDVAERIAYLERDVQEVRTRVNALFFAALTATVGPLIARLF